MYIEASVPPDRRSARNNLYSGISLVRQVRSLISLPCSVSLCFWSFLVSSFPRFLVFRFGSRFVCRSFSRFGFRFVSHSVSRFRFRFVSRSVFRFGFRSVSCSVSRSVSRVGFCSTILGSRPTPVPVPVPVPVPDSVSISPSSRQRLPLLLTLLPRGVALYRRQRLITDSHSARPRRVRSCGSRPRPVTFCCVSG